MVARTARKKSSRPAKKAPKRPAGKSGGAHTPTKGQVARRSGGTVHVGAPGHPKDAYTVIGQIPRPEGAARGIDRTVPLEDVVGRVAAEHPDPMLTDTEAELAEAFLGGLLSSPTANGSRWAELLGPVATPKVLTALLGVTRQGLDKARVRGDVLGVRTSSGNWVYPLRQLRGTHGRVKVIDGLGEVLRVLYRGGDHAGAARWLATPNRRLDGATPWEALDAGETEAAAAAAESQVRAWTAR